MSLGFVVTGCDLICSQYTGLVVKTNPWEKVKDSLWAFTVLGFPAELAQTALVYFLLTSSGPIKWYGHWDGGGQKKGGRACKCWAPLCG